MSGQRRPELGQHYLRSSVARRLAHLSGIGSHDFVVEIGPGRGALTEHLAHRAGRLVAVEIDPRHVRRLTRAYAGRSHIEILEADFLSVRLPSSEFSLVSNIPFGSTAGIIACVLEAAPRDAWLVVQREAAEKYAGHPWASESLQSLRIKPWWHVEIRGFPQRTDFEPPPSVETAILRFSRRDRALIDDARYVAFIEVCFGQADTIARCLRRQLTRTQIRRLSLDLGFSMQARPSDLTFDQWLALYRFTCRTNL